jgi:excisionase family DNA binding protein
MHNLDERYEWVGTREAAARLGVSPSTVERMIRKGELTAERVERPGGSRLLVRFDRPQEPQQAASDDAGSIESGATSEPRQATSDAITMLLVAQLAERDATIGGLHREITTQSERAARAETERDLLRAELERVRARRWWRFW